MEKVLNTPNDIKNESIILTNRKSLKLSGISEFLSSSDTNITLKLKDTTLNIIGNDITILKLDIDSGTLEADGKFDKFTYGKETNIIKRIFKWIYPTYYKWEIFVCFYYLDLLVEQYSQ